MKLPPKDCYLQFPSLPGVYGWIEIDGTPAGLYDEEKKGRTANAYVEAKETEPFKVWFADLRRKKPKDSYETVLSSDGGTHMNGTFFDRANALWTQTTEVDRRRFYSYSGWHITATSEKPFFFPKFARDHPTQRASGDSPRGAITISYHRVVATDAARIPDMNPSASSIEGIARKVCLEKPVKRKSSGVAPPATRDLDDGPFSSISFHYRPEAFLREEGFIETAPPSNLELPKPTAVKKLPRAPQRAASTPQASPTRSPTPPAGPSQSPAPLSKPASASHESSHLPPFQSSPAAVKPALAAPVLDAPAPPPTATSSNLKVARIHADAARLKVEYLEKLQEPEEAEAEASGDYPAKKVKLENDEEGRVKKEEGVGGVAEWVEAGEVEWVGNVCVLEE
ncbi:hypothetical protein JCM8097_004465 [Rhodosporidiobolus ruineniae]